MSSMEILDVKSWYDYLNIVNDIRERYYSNKTQYRPIILFRGQKDSDWDLNTTLERISSKKWAVDEYAELTLYCSTRIQSLTEKEFELPTMKALSEMLGRKEEAAQIISPFYHYWVHLRHHGFPSPLLDWTESPYIAAYFAFEERSNASNAAIFAFIEKPRGIKGTWEIPPKITVLGPNVKTHRRHFLQQSRYTICTEIDNGTNQFAHHQEVIETGPPVQDVLIKICIPYSERIKFLSHLYEMNITRLSLFQSEEALMQTLAFKEIEERA